MSARAKSVEHTVTLITRVGCHLCEVAETQLRALSRELGFTYREADVDASPELKQAFSEKVPVIMVDGREHASLRVDERKLRKALAR